MAAPHKAPIYMSQGEFHFAQTLWHQLPGCNITDMLEQFGAHGLTGEPLQALAERGNGYARGIPALPTAYRRLFEGSRITLGGESWEVIIGYGHSPEHISLYCAAHELLISGDMLLPRISTNVSVFAAFPDDDPLGWFIDSLQSFRKLPENTLVLPSHGLPFRGISSRIDELEQHHTARCGELLEALAEPRCAAELMPVLFPRALDAHQTMFAMGEVIAHLNHLAEKGELQRFEDAGGILKFKRIH